jgi:hypothetical protein
MYGREYATEEGLTVASEPEKSGASAPIVAKKKKRGNPRGNPATLAPAWKPGQSGNPAGRKKGFRNRLGEAFLQDMLSAWEANGKAAIDRVIEERPHEFIKAVAGILPKDVNIRTEAVQELSDDELAAALAALRAVSIAADAREGSEAPSRH